MSIIKSLKTKCAEAGTTLTQVCREAGYQPSAVFRWEHHPPKTLRTIEDLEKVIESKKRGQTKAD